MDHAAAVLVQLLGQVLVVVHADVVHVRVHLHPLLARQRALVHRAPAHVAQQPPQPAVHRFPQRREVGRRDLHPVLRLSSRPAGSRKPIASTPSRTLRASTPSRVLLRLLYVAAFLARSVASIQNRSSSLFRKLSALLEPYRRAKTKNKKRNARPPMVVLPLILLNFNGRGEKRRKEVCLKVYPWIGRGALGFYQARGGPAAPIQPHRAVLVHLDEPLQVAGHHRYRRLVVAKRILFAMRRESGGGPGQGPGPCGAGPGPSAGAGAAHSRAPGRIHGPQRGGDKCAVGGACVLRQAGFASRGGALRARHEGAHGEEPRQGQPLHARVQGRAARGAGGGRLFVGAADAADAGGGGAELPRRVPHAAGRRVVLRWCAHALYARAPPPRLPLLPMWCCAC